MSLDLFTGNGSGGFSDTSTYQTVGQADADTIGLVAGDFQGSTMGLEIAVPVTKAAATAAISTSSRSRQLRDLGRRRASTTLAIRSRR